MLVKTKDGLEIEANEEQLDNMEVLDVLREMDEGNPLAMSKLCSLIFDKENKKKLYDFCRDEGTGRVPFAKAFPVIIEIFGLLGNKSKN